MFAAEDILQGAFVCSYAGELLSISEASRRLEAYDQNASYGHALLVDPSAVFIRQEASKSSAVALKRVGTLPLPITRCCYEAQLPQDSASMILNCMTGLLCTLPEATRQLALHMLTGCKAGAPLSGDSSEIEY